MTRLTTVVEKLDDDALVRKISFGFLALVIIYLLAFLFVSVNKSEDNQAKFLKQLHDQTTEIGVLAQQVEALGGRPNFQVLAPPTTTTTTTPPTTVPTSPSVPATSPPATNRPSAPPVTSRVTTAPSPAPTTAPRATPTTTTRPKVVVTPPTTLPCKLNVLGVCLVPG